MTRMIVEGKEVHFEHNGNTLTGVVTDILHLDGGTFAEISVDGREKKIFKKLEQRELL